MVSIRNFFDDIKRGITGNFAVLNEVAKNAAHTAITAIDTLIPGDISKSLIPKVDDKFFPTYTVNVGADLDSPIIDVPSDQSAPLGVHRNLMDIVDQIPGPATDPIVRDNNQLVDTNDPVKQSLNRQINFTVSPTINSNDQSNNYTNYSYSHIIHNNYTDNSVNYYNYNALFTAYDILDTSRNQNAVSYGNFFTDIAPVYQVDRYDKMWSSQDASLADIRHSIEPQVAYVYDLIKGGTNYDDKRNKRRRKA